MLLQKLLITFLLSIYFTCDHVSGDGIAAPTFFSFASYVYDSVKCCFDECCGQPWIINNASSLQHDLDKKLYGQHLASCAIHGHIKSHVMPGWQPKRALSLSLDGWVGTGKNYVSTIIAENLYKKGMHSKFVHLISASKEFPHANRVAEYKERIRTLIESSVRRCPQSLFIFDEMEKVPGGVIDTLQPYLQPYEELDGVDYRRAIFLFLGNTRGNQIAEYVLEHWRAGKNRENIQLRDIEFMIPDSALYTEKQMGVYSSDLGRNEMMTAYLPFLPLNRTHIRQCAEDVLVQRRLFRRGKVPRKLLDKVLESLTYYPKEEGVFSTSGCKRVAEKINYVY